MKKQVFVLLSTCCLLIATLPAAAQDAAECEAGFRSVEHAYGAVCVPEQPENVATLDITVFELLLVTETPLAVKSDLLIQSLYAQAHPDKLEEILDLTEDLPDIGFPPNFEVLAEAHPELIIGASNLITADIYPLLSQIAPTYVLEVEPGDWRGTLQQAGEALNTADEVDALLADYAAREDEFRELVGDDLSDIEVSLVRALPGQVGIMLTGSLADRVVSEVGLARPEAQVRDFDYVFNELAGRSELLISSEQLDLAEGDVVLVFGNTTELFADPIWETLDVVLRGDVHEVPYYWYVGGLISAHYMLDDLFAIVAGAESTLPNPFVDGLHPSR